MIERTLILVKPDGVERGLTGEIISRFEKGGLKIIALEGPITVDLETAGIHYQLDNYDYVLTLGHVDVSGRSEEEKKAIYQKNYKIIEDLQHFLASGEIFKMILEGDNAILRAREIVGKTDPAQSPKGSIRGDLGIDSFEKANAEKRSVHNLVHASGAFDEAEREIALWFDKYQTLSKS